VIGRWRDSAAERDVFRILNPVHKGYSLLNESRQHSCTPIRPADEREPLQGPAPEQIVPLVCISHRRRPPPTRCRPLQAVAGHLQVVAGPV